jgi:hypothetical protein
MGFDFKLDGSTVPDIWIELLPDMPTVLRYCAHSPSIRTFRTDEGDAGLATRNAVNGDHVVLRMNGHVIEVLEGEQAACSGLAGDQSC